jgi:hypothetical protein
MPTPNEDNEGAEEKKAAINIDYYEGKDIAAELSSIWWDNLPQ